MERSLRGPFKVLNDKASNQECQICAPGYGMAEWLTQPDRSAFRNIEARIHAVTRVPPPPCDDE